MSGAAVEDRVHIYDLHATILHLLGIDHMRLTYRYAGRDFRLTDVYGNVIRGILNLERRALGNVKEIRKTQNLRSV